MKVRNLNGTTRVSASWLAHWEARSGQTAYGCFVVGCRNRRSVGGLVQKADTADTDWYVVPLCEDCGRMTGHDLDIWDLAKLVPADADRTHEKPHEKQPAPSRAPAMGSA
jgi:hypothetical protein